MPINVNGIPCILADGVRETTDTVGTGSYSLRGARTVDEITYRTVVAGIGDGNTSVFTVRLGSGWESFVGTVAAGTPAQLTRDQILSSSNGGSAVSWGAGDKDLILDVPAAVFHSLQAQIDPLASPTLPLLRTQQTTTSESSKDFTGIVALNEIVIMINHLGTNGTNSPIIQLGDSGGIETTGYDYSVSAVSTGTATGGNANAAGFAFNVPWSASATFSTIARLHRMTGNTWLYDGTTSSDTGFHTAFFAGTKTLSGVLDRIRLSTPDVFDNGAWNIREVS